MINRTTFFAYARRAPFGNRLTQAQVDGMTALLDAWANVWQPRCNLRVFAYILATAFHETGGRMVAVREGFAKTDAAARKIVASRRYGQPDEKTGHVYYGRGLVQITWAENYRRMGEIVGCDLLNDPDAALVPAIAVDVLFEGMLKGVSKRGDFTGRSLSDYFGDGVEDPVGARAVVNGKDKANLIAGYYDAFLGALQAADTGTPQPADVVAASAKADGPALATDKTVLGTLTGVLSAGGAGFLAAVDNPWALLAVGLVVVGAILFLTGRLKIRREAGA